MVIQICKYAFRLVKILAMKVCHDTDCKGVTHDCWFSLSRHEKVKQKQSSKNSQEFEIS